MRDAAPAQPPVNRNGVVGDFAAFAPVRKSIDRVVEEAVAERRGRRRVDPRPPRHELAVGEHALVRYHLGSDELRDALKAVGAEDHWIPPELTSMTAVFGIVSPDGRTELVVEAIDDGDGPRISLVFAAKERTLPRETLLAFLDHLDLPPSRRMGTNLTMAELFDAYWSEDGWEAKPQRHLVKVGFRRHCFGTAPPLDETVDVFLPPSPDHDLADPDETRAYWAKDHYREAAWGELARLPQCGIRPGFSDWTYGEQEPRLVKVLDATLNATIDRPTAEAEEDAPAAPAP